MADLKNVLGSLQPERLFPGSPDFDNIKSNTDSGMVPGSEIIHSSADDQFLFPGIHSRSGTDPGIPGPGFDFDEHQKLLTF